MFFKTHISLWRICVGAFFLTVVAFSSSAFSQSFELLPEIIIESATLSSEDISTDETGSAVSVVSGETLERAQFRHAGDALRSLPGVHVNRTGSNGALTQVRIRGSEVNHVLVLIDGIEANATADGAFDFSDLSVGSIEKIELVRGPQSGLYGSSAVGGVINIITKRGNGPLTLALQGEGGSFSTGVAGVVLSGGNDRIYGAISFNKDRSKGFNISPSGDEKDGYERGSFHFKGGVKIFENLSLEGVFGRISKTGDRDGQPVGVGAIGSLQPAVDTASTFGTDIFMTGLEAKLLLLEGRWEQKIRINHNETNREDTSVDPVFGAFFSRNDSEAQTYAYLSSWHFDLPELAVKHTLTALVERQSEAFTPVTNDNIERERQQTSYAAELRGAYFEKLFLSAALRRDDNDSFDDETTYRLAGSYLLPDVLEGIQLRAHGSVGTGIKNPSLFEQFGSLPSFGFVANPDLIAEQSFGWDGGVEFSLFKGRGVLDVTYFQQDLENAIRTLFAPVFTAVNLPGTSEREGLEVTLHLQLMEGLSVVGNYTYLDATRADGTREVRRPEHSGHADVYYTTPDGRGKINLGLVYNGKMDDIALRNNSPFSFARATVELEEYYLLRLAGSYEVRDGVALFARVENLLDQGYQEVFGFETAGFTAYGGLRIKLDLEKTSESE